MQEGYVTSRPCMFHGTLDDHDASGADTLTLRVPAIVAAKVGKGGYLQRYPAEGPLIK